jgi:hypothetical protein
MGNIIGEGFRKEIHAQVLERQVVFGSTDRQKYLRYLNGRSPWIKLTSSTNISEPRIALLATKKITTTGGNELAKNNVLFGGTSIGDTIRKGYEQTYTVGGLSQGYRPMPGIISLESKNRNRGSVRETTVQIKAYNTEQFNIIDVLYLRLGFTVLLEWGHSVYITNEGTVKDMNSTDTLSSNFLNGTYANQNVCMEAIIKNKLALQGNYDAIYGKVSNFSWSFEQDGTYNISLSIVSLGDVIESIKVNTIAVGEFQTTEQKQENEEDLKNADTEAEILEYSKNKDAISKLFYDAKEKLASGTANGQVTTVDDTAAKDLGFESGSDLAMFVETTGRNEDRYYVRLGGFLYYIRNNRLFYNKDIPVVEMDFDENTNLIFTTPYVLSSDPRVCIVKAPISMTGFDKVIFPDLPKDFKEEVEGVTVGKLMNVYINMTYIVKAMDELKDKDGKVSLYDLLNKICEGINTSLGNVNKISPTIDEENNNKVYLLDETSLPNRTAIIKNKNSNASTELTRFEIFGYKPEFASFITSLGIKTEITNDLATMITVGAQASGGAVGEDATAFSKWNDGLEDRVFKIKASTPTPLTSEQTNQAAEAAAKEQEAIDKKNENTIKEYSNFISKMEELNFDDSIDSFPTVLSNFLELMQVQESVSKKTASPTIGFIPINLNLSMVGLSGMKIYQKFSINQNFLPSNYEETLEFLLKGITQTVNDKGWITSIEALSIPLSVSSGASPPLSYTQPPLTTTETGTPTTTGGSIATSAAEQKAAASILSGVTPGKCGVKVITNTVPGLDKPTDTIRKSALQASYNAVFSGPKENIPSPYMCGRWTFNLAYNYTQALNKKPLSKGATIAAGGDANSPGYWASLVKIGYGQYVAAKNASKTEIISLLNGKIQFNLGDVVVYFSNDKPTHLHTQIYIGTNQIKEIQGGIYPTKGGWATDNYSNYSREFVYRKDPQNCYNLLVFRAPLNSGVTADANQSRNAYIKIAQELNKILTLQDKFYRADGTALLSDAKGRLNDDEQLAINHLNEVLGFSSTSQAWSKKLQPQYQSLSPADKKLFDSEYNKLKELIKNGSTNSNASTNFSLPLSTDPKTNKFITVAYNF